MVEWRLIIDGEHDPYWNMAFDETLLYLREQSYIPNTLRLYVFKPGSVTIGYFQRISEAVDLDYANRNGILYTRRITGGGAVYHDPNGELTYSVVASLSDFPSDVIERYRAVCYGLIYALEYFGLKSEFKPVNDIVVNNKKISGSAQTWRKYAFLQHGTFMYNTDINTLANVLKPLREKLISHGIDSIKERVTTLSMILKKSIDGKEVLETLIRGFEKAFKTSFTITQPSSFEIELARKLVDKYRSREWIFKK
ncbi:MAG: biotin/lipoate A/B protein ligase family protein [Desulfurococcaceae archaeon]